MALDSKPPPVPALTGLQVAGFKSLSHRQKSVIEFRPLTVLSGANSSGKSSLMQSMLLLKQTLEAVHDAGALLLDGPNVRFSSADQLFSRLGRQEAVDAFEVEMQFGSYGSARWKFCRDAATPVAVRLAEFKGDNRSMRLSPGMTVDELKEELPKDDLNVLQKLFFEPVVVRTKFSLSVGFRRKGSAELTPSLYNPPLAGLADRFLRQLIHLPGLRGNPERTYRMSAVEGVFPGTFEAYTAALISNWKTSKSSQKLAEVNADLNALGLAWGVTANRINDTQVELVVGRLPRPKPGGAHDLVNIADVGFGVSQTLPVVVALHAAAPGQCVYLEQPEIHLHPRAQVAMAGVLARAVRRGVQVVVETHSSLLLLALQTMVAEAELLTAEDMVLHWFERDEETGSTTIRSAHLDADGAYGDWPENFGRVELELEAKYLDAVDARFRRQTA